MSKQSFRADAEAFLDEMAVLMAPWGWARPVARMYGYLLLQDEPVTLDRLAADLGIAKSNASVAARTLERFGNARRQTEPGTKRILYSAPDLQSGPFSSKVTLLATLERLLLSAAAAEHPDSVATRLRAMADFHGEMRAAMEAVLSRSGRR